VSEWRKEWESVWSGDTGMDIQGELNKLELIGQENEEVAAQIHVHSSWGVSIHDVKQFARIFMLVFFSKLRLK